MSKYIPIGCFQIISSIWVDLYHALTIKNAESQAITQQWQMQAIRTDLDSCRMHLVSREKELEKRIAELSEQAKRKAMCKDMIGARRKLMDRKRSRDQLDRISNSICIIESHSDAIEGTEWNKSVLNTLRASADAIRQLNVQGGITEVENIISDVETQMEHAAEITKVIHAGNVSGAMNSMQFGDYINDDDLERDLQELMDDGELEVVDLHKPIKRAPSAISVETHTVEVSLQDDGESVMKESVAI